MTGLVTTLTYPRGTAFVSGTVSEGTLSADGKKWTGVNLVTGEDQTIEFIVEITDQSLFDTGTKTVKAVTVRYPSEVIVVNNTILKVIE